MPRLHAAVDRVRQTRNGAAPLGEVYASLPAELHHLNTIRGLILAARVSGNNLDPDRTETLTFTQIDGTTRSARVPLFTFIKDFSS